MNAEVTAARLATKLSTLTLSDKIEWKEALYIIPQGVNFEMAFEARVNGGTMVVVGEAQVPRSSLNSYGFVLIENGKEVFDVFAEGVPAEPTDEQRQMWHALKDLFYAARDSARGTKQKVEQFEQLLEKLA